MSPQTKTPQKPIMISEARLKPQPPPATNEALVSSPRPYWGDRMTLLFWLFCFGLMLAMNVIEAIHRFVVFLMAANPTP